MTEEELIDGCIRKDRRSQNELYKRYFSMMSGIALRYYRNQDDALQAMNMAFLKVLQSIERFDRSYKLATWIRNILVHHIIDEFRKNQKHDETHVYTDDLPPSSSTNLAEYRFSEQDLREMLFRLPTMTRTVFDLFAIEGYAHKEVAEMLNISTGTSKWHVSDARKKLAEMMKEREKKEKKMIGMTHEQ